MTTTITTTVGHKEMKNDLMCARIKLVQSRGHQVKCKIGKKTYDVIWVNQDSVMLKNESGQSTHKLHLVTQKGEFYTEKVIEVKEQKWPKKNKDTKNTKENLRYRVSGFGKDLGFVYANNIEDAYGKAVEQFGKKDVYDVRRQYYRSSIK